LGEQGGTMKIVKTKDQNAIQFLVEPIKKFIEKDEIIEYTHEAFIKWLRYSISIPSIGVWLVQNDDKIIGFAIANIQSTLDHEFVNITQLFGEQEEIEYELINKISEWSKKNGIKIVLTSSKFPKKWKRMGFEIEAHTLKMEV
jgi:hypothetical protein